MGGEIRWSEIVIVADFLGEPDVYLLVHGLIEVREFFRRREAARQRAQEVEAEIRRAGI